MTNDECEQLILSTIARVDIWRLRVQQGCDPAVGSDLFQDDAVDRLLTYAPSQLVFASLSSARDHLGAFHQLVLARSLHPFACRTLLRTAVASAATAVWVLSPTNREVRIRRARSLAGETLNHHVSFLRLAATESSDLTAEQNADNATILAAGEAAKRRLDSLRDLASQKDRFNQTEVIKQAVRASVGAEHEAAATMEWQRGSGAAHGLLWSLLGLRSTRQVTPPNGDGIAGFAAAGDFASVIEIHQLAYLLLQKGWKLLDQRLATR